MSPTKAKKTSENTIIPEDVNIELKPDTKECVEKKSVCTPKNTTEQLQEKAELILIGGLRLKLSDEDALNIKKKMGSRGRYNLRTGEILLLDAVIGIVNPKNLIG